MSWILLLIFLATSHSPEYITVRSEDRISCAEQGKEMKQQVPELHWLCIGPDGELIGDTHGE